ncbi:MAG: PAS domain-containing protein [Syntrophobacteraceae bacterium]
MITQRNFVENILESSPNGIITTDCKRRIRSMNRRAEQIFDLERSAVFGRRVFDVFGTRYGKFSTSPLKETILSITERFHLIQRILRIRSLWGSVLPF